MEKPPVERDVHPEVENCSNCGSELEGPYCSACGQENRPAAAPLCQSFSTVIDDLFSLDGRVLLTLRFLISRPGHLTSEYLAGRMVRYTHPLRLFLVTGVAAFAAAELVPSFGTGILFIFAAALASGAGEWAPWVVLAASLPFLSLLHRVAFPHRQFFAEHLVFVLHLQSFAFLALILESLTLSVFPPVNALGHFLASVFLAVVVGYWVLSLRDCCFYGEKEVKRKGDSCT